MQVDLMPGVGRLLKNLKKNGIPTAVATTSSEEYLKLKTEKNHGQMFERGNYFSHLVMADSDAEVVNGKPAPDINLICAKRFGNCL